MSYFKNNPARDENYLAWVRLQPSPLGGFPCDAHHIEGHGLGGTGKCSDYFTIPLTRDQHQEFHALGWETWERTYGINQLEHAARLLEKWCADVKMMRDARP